MLIRRKQDWDKYKKTFEKKFLDGAAIVHFPDSPEEWPCHVSSSTKLNGYNGVVNHYFFYQGDARLLLEIKS